MSETTPETTGFIDDGVTDNTAIIQAAIDAQPSVNPTFGTQDPIEEPATETTTIVFEEDGSTNDAAEVIERSGTTSVSRQYRQLTGLDTADE